MKFALLNPNWDFTGSTYFGCREPHIPLELLFACDQLRAAGHDSLLIDAQTDNLTLQEARRRVRAFAPDFLVIPTAPSYLFWRCPPPELRVPMEWFAGLESPAIKVAIGPHPSATPASRFGYCRSRKTRTSFIWASTRSASPAACLQGR